MTRFVLASASPRRIELTRRAGLDCIIDPADIDEDAVKPSSEAAAILSKRKAEAVAPRHPAGTIIIAADTVVVCDRIFLGKPRDEEEAFSTLKTLAGRTHTVLTGVTVLQDGRALTRTEPADVTMRALTDAQIRAYIATGEPMDKAGAYGIQERGALLVERVEGDFYTVMGLPLCLLATMLYGYGVDLLC
ncbi:MAG: Maf family protein [Oscillospiraceae bacterium]|jgi:septum formation protein|nr:Maf family protein [Oscillospiraceae bacterium]